MLWSSKKDFLPTVFFWAKQTTWQERRAESSSVPEQFWAISWAEVTCSSGLPEHQGRDPDKFLSPQFSDYQNYLVNSCVKENPTMERSIALCNGISQWVQLMVLSRPTPQLRAEVFIKFIQVAQVSDGVQVWPGLWGKLPRLLPRPTKPFPSWTTVGLVHLKLSWDLDMVTFLFPIRGQCGEGHLRGQNTVLDLF